MFIENFIERNIFEIKNQGIPVVIRKIFTLTKTFFLIPIYLISLPILVFIHLISPWYLIRFQDIVSSRIGHFSINTELYCCEIDFKINLPKQKYLDLFYYKDISNKQLAIMWKRKLNVLPNWLLSPIHNINKFFVNFLPTLKIHSIGRNTCNDRDVLNLIDKCKTHLEFTNEEEVLGKEILKKFGLSEKDKFVCLTIYDSSYLNTYHPYSAWNYHKTRSFDVNNFMLAAEEIAKRGYYVFRMGKIVSKPFQSNNPKIIDYSNSDLKSDFMDIYLAAKCSLCISGSSGFESVTQVFRKPLVQIVVPLLDAKTWSGRALVLTKHYYSNKKQKMLSLSEILTSSIANCIDFKKIEAQGIKLMDNSPDEIKDIALEAIDRLEGKWKSMQIDKELQDKFWKIYYSSDLINSYRFRHKELKAKFSSKFLRKNPDWVN